MIIGITGQSGSGKSTAVSYLKEYEFVHIDLDQLGHQSYFDPKVRALLYRHFGNLVFINGVIDRNRLAKIVFNDNEQLQILNNIIHPYIYRMTQKYIQSK